MSKPSAFVRLGFSYIMVMAKNSEHIEQVKFIQYVRVFHPDLDGLYWATPNGGKRDVKEAVRLKAEGVRRGVPDIQFAIPSGTKYGLFLEFKRPDGKGVVSKEQKFVMGKLEANGYKCAVVKNTSEAKNILNLYLLGYF